MPSKKPVHLSLVSDGWEDAVPSPLKTGKSALRTPHMEPDGTLVFSEDDLDSPVAPVVKRNVIDKTVGAVRLNVRRSLLPHAPNSVVPRIVCSYNALLRCRQPTVPGKAVHFGLQ